MHVNDRSILFTRINIWYQTTRTPEQYFHYPGNYFSLLTMVESEEPTRERRS